MDPESGTKSSEYENIVTKFPPENGTKSSEYEIIVTKFPRWISWTIIGMIVVISTIILSFLVRLSSDVTTISMSVIRSAQASVEAGDRRILFQQPKHSDQTHHIHFQEAEYEKGVHCGERERRGNNATQGSTKELSLPYRTAFHFQPAENWMNDPTGMMFYRGWYHLFYQYNPDGALWGNIVWGHAVSRDLIYWSYLDHSIIGGPDWYDIYGAWSGSTTILDDGTPAILYTGWSNVSSEVQIQTQNLVLPVDINDPLLREWYKSEANPVMVAEPWMDATKYRDPTEAWKGKDGQWRTIIGARLTDNFTGTSHLYKSKDFVNWTYSHDIHMINGTGMWECPDFFPVALRGRFGLGVSVMNPTVKHVLKVSLDNNKHDYYSIGTYDEETDTFKGDHPPIEVGLGLRYDYGKFYASKTFFDQKTGRRILFGWLNESDSDLDAITNKGWSGIQALPRQVWLDPRTKLDLIQAPIREVNLLHRDMVSNRAFTLEAGSVRPVKGVHGAQLDIQIKFHVPELMKHDFLYDGSDKASLKAQEVCSQMGTAHPGYLGPFGIIVLATKHMEEHTAIYYYLLMKDGAWNAILCSDQSKSSLQTDVDKTVYGAHVRVYKNERYLTMRTIVDHSVIETFAHEGRAVVTSRVYPTMAMNQDAHFYLFNNGTQDIEVHSFHAWKMDSIDINQM